MKTKMQVLAFFSLLFGGCYILLPEIEVEARYWGVLSVIAGLVIFALHPRIEKNVILKWVGVVGFGLLAIAQWFPVQAWTFSPMITDHGESSVTQFLAENGHLGVIPHLILFSLSLHLALSFLRDVLKKKWEVLSVWLILALTMGTWSLVWLADFRNTFDNVMKDNNPQIMGIDIDQLQYQMKEAAKEVSEEGYWEAAEGGYWLESKELELRFFIPDLWLSGDPEEQSIYPETTTFKNNVIQGEKWEFQMQGAGFGMWPKMMAYRNLYPAVESFLYALNSGKWDYYETLYQANMDVSYSDAELACDSFKALVIVSGDCMKVEGLPMNVYQLDYATYTAPEFFAVSDATQILEPEIVGGFIWFVSLEGYDSVYDGFQLNYQMTEPLKDEGLFHEQGTEGIAQDFFDSVLEIKSNEDYKEFEQAALRLLSSVKAL